MFDDAGVLRVSPPGRLDPCWPDPFRRPVQLRVVGGDGATLPRFHDPARRRPADLRTARPDGWLALAADTVTKDPAALDDAELIDAMVVFERLTAWTSARQARLLAEFARRRPAHDPDTTPDQDTVDVSRYAADEVGLALRLSPGTASIRLEQARRLDADLPDTLHAWEAGRLDATKVRAILDATAPLDPTIAAAVATRVLPRATDQTAGQLRAALGRAVQAVDAEGAARRHEHARAERRVAVNPGTDGMASLAALLPAPDALSAFEWLTRLARGMGPDDPRRMDARRADLLVALLTGRLTVAPPDTGDDDGQERVTMPEPVNPGKPLIQVVVPLDTLTGATDHPGELIGYGPIPADLTRRIAADGVWKRLITDPLSGALLDHGRTTYRPPTALADFIRARDVHCRHPICRRRALDSELDHTIAYTDNGPTTEHNLHSSCTRHHHTKHDAPGWTVTQHPDATITWTTPTGHRYDSKPHDYRPDEPDHSNYILDHAARHSGPAPPPPNTAMDDPPPF